MLYTLLTCFHTKTVPACMFLFLRYKQPGGSLYRWPRARTRLQGPHRRQGAAANSTTCNETMPQPARTCRGADGGSVRDAADIINSYPKRSTAAAATRGSRSETRRAGETVAAGPRPATTGNAAQAASRETVAQRPTCSPTSPQGTGRTAHRQSGCRDDHPHASERINQEVPPFNDRDVAAKAHEDRGGRRHASRARGRGSKTQRRAARGGARRGTRRTAHETKRAPRV